jgi:hypothetical protein
MVSLYIGPKITSPPALPPSPLGSAKNYKSKQMFFWFNFWYSFKSEIA